MRLDIKKQLKKANITRYKLAKLLDVSYPTISKIYNGEASTINLNTLEQLCIILNCTPNDVLVFENLNKIKTESENIDTVKNGYIINCSQKTSFAEMPSTTYEIYVKSLNNSDTKQQESNDVYNVENAKSH